MNITIDGGKTIKLKTVGKYCDRDITVTATGGGGEEINMEVCTLKIAVPSSSNYYFAYEKVSSGAITYQIDRNYASGTLTKTVRCNSIIYIQASTIKGVTIDEGEMIRLISGYGIVCRTPSTGGTVVNITLSA